MNLYGIHGNKNRNERRVETVPFQEQNLQDMGAGLGQRMGKSVMKEKVVFQDQQGIKDREIKLCLQLVFKFGRHGPCVIHSVVLFLKIVFQLQLSSPFCPCSSLTPPLPQSIPPHAHESSIHIPLLAPSPSFPRYPSPPSHLVTLSLFFYF